LRNRAPGGLGEESTAECTFGFTVAAGGGVAFFPGFPLDTNGGTLLFAFLVRRGTNSCVGEQSRRGMSDVPPGDVLNTTTIRCRMRSAATVSTTALVAASSPSKAASIVKRAVITTAEEQPAA